MRRLGRLVCLILLTSLISAEEIKDKCKSEASWASCPSHFAYKLNYQHRKLKNNVKMRRLGSLVRLISLTSIISAEESKKKCKNDFFCWSHF